MIRRAVFRNCSYKLKSNKSHRSVYMNHPRIHGMLYSTTLKLQQGTTADNDAKDTFSYRVGNHVANLKHSLAKYLAHGLTSKNLYESCADMVSHEEFFKACNMPDTFQSWFYVMQLHVWMLLVRLRSEGAYGKKISYKMVELMWQDVEERMKLIGVEDTSERNETLQEFAQQFFGLIVAYDEGILGHDRVLASALWRNFFYNNHNTNAESLAMMVGYIRKQMQHLDKQDSDELVLNGKVNWLPLYEENVSSGNVK